MQKTITYVGDMFDRIFIGDGKETYMNQVQEDGKFCVLGRSMIENIHLIVDCLLTGKNDLHINSFSCQSIDDQKMVYIELAEEYLLQFYLWINDQKCVFDFQ